MISATASAPGAIPGVKRRQWEAVRFDPDRGRARLQGYPAGAKGASPPPLPLSVRGLRLIAFELGLSFFTDYFKGNVYFKANRPEQNPAGALVQFRLTESIEAQEAAIRAFIRDLK